MLSKTELLYLKGELEVEGNVNYDRVLACRIRKKIEKRVKGTGGNFAFAVT
jgi:hypothetical protein